MATERVIDFYVQPRFGEMYAAILKFSLRKLRVLLVLATVIFVSTGIVLMHASLLDPPDDRWTSFAYNLRPLFYLACAFVLLIPVTSLINTVKTLRDPRRKSGFKYQVTDKGIHVEGSTGSSDFNWTAFLEAREGSDSFLLYVTGTLFHIIPKRCFASSDDLTVFRDLLRANISLSLIHI